MSSVTANSPLSAAAKPSSSSSSPQPKSPNPRPLSLPLKPKNLTPLRCAANPPPASPSSAVSFPSLKSRLRAGDTLYGLFLLSSSPTIAEIAAFAGYDFVVVDMEHGPGRIPESLDCIRALAATRTPANLRLPESTAVWAKKALDIGPEGIMFPMIDGPTHARDAVSYCRFPPKGVRGSAHPVVRASKYGIDEGYLENCEENQLIMCQVKSVEGVKNAREIASVDGVDCIQMGPLDLSASMGYLWDPANKKVREMMRKAEEGVMGSGTAYLAGFAMPHDSPLDLRRGYNMVSGALDVGLFRSAAVEDVKRFKMGFGKESSSDDEESEKGNDVDEKYWSEERSTTRVIFLLPWYLAVRRDLMRNADHLSELTVVIFMRLISQFLVYIGHQKMFMILVSVLPPVTAQLHCCFYPDNCSADKTLRLQT